MSIYGLPDGVSLGMVAAVLIPVGIVTVLLRALPFSMLRVLKGSPFIDFLAVLMPVGVMTVLVAYTLVGYAGSPPTSPPRSSPWWQPCCCTGGSAAPTCRFSSAPRCTCCWLTSFSSRRLFRCFG